MEKKTLTSNHIYCVPGDRLCVSDDHNLAGPGTYIYRNYIYSALSGVVRVETGDNGTSSSNQNSNVIIDSKTIDQSSNNRRHHPRTITVVHDLKHCHQKLPPIGSLVTCRVVYINNSQAKCQINCVNDQLLRLSFKGILRKENVRAEDKDRVEMHACYRPRDIILARVYDVTDKGYLLTTAEDELGVVIAYNENNNPLVPISWSEMVCPETYVKERRKIARIIAGEQPPPPPSDSIQ